MFDVNHETRDNHLSDFKLPANKIPGTHQFIERFMIECDLILHEQMCSDKMKDIN